MIGLLPGGVTVPSRAAVRSAIQSVSPATDVEAGGAKIRVYLTRCYPGDAITIDGTAANVDSPDTSAYGVDPDGDGTVWMDVIVPAGSGLVDVAFAGNQGSDTLSNGFQYSVPQGGVGNVVSALNADGEPSGVPGQEITVTVDGTMPDPPVITICGALAGSPTKTGAATATCTVPDVTSGARGLGNVTVEDAVLVDGFTMPYTYWDFENYNDGDALNGQGLNNFSWRSLTPKVSTDVAHKGTKSYKGVYAGTGAALTGQNREFGFYFNTAGTETLTEVWMEWWLYFDSVYVYDTSGPGAPNNKLLAIWGGGTADYSTRGAIQAVMEYQGTTNGEIHVHMGSLRSNLDGSSYGSADANTDRYTIADPTTDLPSTWHRLRIHMRVGDNDTDFGSFQAWFDDALIAQAHADYMIYTIGDGGTPPAYNWLNVGYFMGPANTGFAVDTPFYLDEVAVYDADPGWAGQT